MPPGINTAVAAPGQRDAAPLVSVIIPTYNCARWISTAIDGALSQTLANREIIVVDDGSADDTARIVAARFGDRVHYLKKPNGGVSSARNAGIAAARGTFAAFLDADDSWSPTWLETAIGAIDARPSIGAVYGNLTVIDDNGRQLGGYDLSQGGRYDGIDIRYALSNASGLLGSNVVVRRDLAQAVGCWDESLRTAEDLDFALRLATVTRIAIIRAPLIIRRECGASLSKQVNTGNRLKVIAKFEAQHPGEAARYAGLLRRVRGRILCDYGEDLLWHRQIAQAEEHLVESLRARPGLRAAWLLLKAQLLKAVGGSR